MMLSTVESNRLLQMEIPLEQNWLAVKQAKAQGIQVVVNVAPAGLIPEEALNEIDFLVVNEEEARCLVELYEERVRFVMYSVPINGK